MIIAKDLIKNYGELRAIDGVNFEIAEGECIGLLGLNGAGKSTLLRILSCLLMPTSGKVTVGSQDVTHSPEFVRARIGYLPEDPPLYGEMKVGKLLDFVARLRGVPATDVGGRVQHAVERCQLTEVIDQQIETLSYGYRKRVGIAQAIVHDPPLLILDEPIAGLDPAQIVEMREMIRSMRGEHTLVLSSHILGEISQTCDRILVMHQGKIIGAGTEEELSLSLAKDQRLQVRLRASADQVKQVLDGRAAVTEWKIAAQDEGVITVKINTSEDVRAELSRAFVQADLDLLALGRVHDRLETAFLKLTGDSTEAAS